MAKRFFRDWKDTSLLSKILLIIIALEFAFISHFKLIFGAGMSMYPAIKNHQILICKYTDTYAVNDIVLYKVNNMTIVHRITNINTYKLNNGQEIITYKVKGDNNETEDMFELYPENIVCKIVGVK